MMDWAFIRGIKLNKNAENLDGYVKNLSIIEGLTEIEFRKPRTFVGENGAAENQHFLCPLLLDMDLILKEALKIFAFLQMKPTRISMSILL